MGYVRAIRTAWRKKQEFARMQRYNQGKRLDETAGLPPICLGEVSSEDPEERRLRLAARIEALRHSTSVDRRTWDRLDLGFEEQTYQRQKSLKFIRLQIELVRYSGGHVVVEIGSARSPLRHSLTEFNPVCCNDGHSTHHWASCREFEVDTVDINPASRVVLERAGYPNLRAHTGDGIAFLRNWSGRPIDLLYLDAWDVGTTEYAERHLEAYQAAHDKLAPRHVIGIDDTDFVGAGKGKLLVPHLMSVGYRLLAEGRQTVLCNFE